MPLADDLRLRHCVLDIGLVIYSGVWLFKALYVRIALLYDSRL